MGLRCQDHQQHVDAPRRGHGSTAAVAATLGLALQLLPVVILLVRRARKGLAVPRNACAPDAAANTTGSNSGIGKRNSSGGGGSTRGSASNSSSGSTGGAALPGGPRSASASSPPPSPFLAAAQLPALSAPTSPPRRSMFESWADDSAHLPLCSGCSSPHTRTALFEDALDAARICSRAADTCRSVQVVGQSVTSTGPSPFATAAARARCCPWRSGSEPALVPPAAAPALPQLPQLGLPAALSQSLVDPAHLTFARRHGRLVVLGRGAGGSVVLGSLRGQAVAAKILSLGPDDDGSTKARQAFLAEAAHLHALQHPTIVSFFGLAVIKSKGILILEHCEGKDLHNALALAVANQRVFAWHRSGQRVASDVAKALAFVHAQGYVHADVKSSNVLLTKSGTAKLADLGLTRRASAAGVEPAVGTSDALELPGTLNWMAPEVLLGTEPTQASDIYSYGVLLWEIITGASPQRGCLRLPRVPEECPQAASDLMVQCMSLDPGARPTAAEVLERVCRLRRPASLGSGLNHLAAPAHLNRSHSLDA